MYRHGGYGTPTYRVWIQLRRRCNDKKNHNYLRYGGRGIAVCARWDDFQNFLDDMGERPKGHTIDRIDNDVGYQPDNCRWANALMQVNNRRNTRNITYKGVTKHVYEWAIYLGVKKECLINRVYVYKWPIERAFTESVRGY